MTGGRPPSIDSRRKPAPCIAWSTLMTWTRALRLSIPALAFGLALGCDDDPADEVIPAETGEALVTYADIVHATYADSLAAAIALDAAIDGFLDTRDAEGLQAARDAWLAAREPYLQSEVFRFYGGPIDDEVDGPEGMINAWPLDEAYIDGVADDPTAGIVNDTAEMITADNLAALNEQGGEENIATGFHAIEFLLWGQDTAADGPGDRPHTDFVDGEAPNADRRRLYLATVSDLLVEHLTALEAEWDPASGAYRAGFLADPAEDGLRKVLTGMIVLAGFETGGERLQTALDSGDQEDEHSCFSDNTHRDMVQDVRGIQNVWRGRYGAVSGPGVMAIVEARDAALAGRIDARVDESLALAEALQPPFDREIAAGNTEGNARVRALIESLRMLEDDLEVAFRAFELSIPVVE